MLNGAPAGPDGRPAAAIDAFADAMSESYRSGGDGARATRQAWFFRMVFAPGRWRTDDAGLAQPLCDQRNQGLRQRTLAGQHDTQRKLWRSPVSQMHLAMLRDEAMLSWLDGDGKSAQLDQRKPGPRVPGVVRPGRGQLRRSRRPRCRPGVDRLAAGL